MDLNAATIRRQRYERMKTQGYGIRAAGLDSGFFSDRTILQRLTGATGSELIDPYRNHLWTYAALRAITVALSSVPLLAMKGTRDQKATPEAGQWQALIDDPSPLFSLAEWTTVISGMLQLYGECFVLKIGRGGLVGSENEMPTELLPIPPLNWEPKNAKGSTLEYGQTIAKWSYNGIDYLPHQLIWIRDVDIANPMRGLSPCIPTKTAADSDYAMQTWNSAFFKNGADPGGTIEHEFSTESQIQTLKTAFNDEHRGPSKRGKTLVLPKGAKYTPNVRNQKDMEFLAGQEYYRNAVLAARGVHKAILGITEDLNYATHLGQHRVFWEHTVLPHANLIAESFYRQLTKPIDDSVWFKFETSNVPAMNSDFSERLTQGATLINVYGYSADQVNERLRLGMPQAPKAIEQGDPLLDALATDVPTTTAPAPITTVQDTAFNGAQVSSLVEVVAQVSAGTLPPEAAKQIILVAFPTVDEAQATAMIESAAALAETNAEAPLIEELPRFAIHMGKRVISDRRGYIAAYVRGVVIPNERKLSLAMRRYLSALGKEQQNLLRAWLRQNGLDGSDIATFKESDIDAILFQRERWDRAIRASASPSIEATVKSALRATSEEVGGAFIPFSDPRVSDLMGKTLATLVQVNATTQDRIRAQLLTSAAQGESIAQAQARLTPWVEENPARALLIARTENGMASSGARYVGLEDAEISTHEWINAGSGDIRESHQDKPLGVGGEIVKLGERFSNGMLHPHEIGADPGDVCHCRCEALAAE